MVSASVAAAASSPTSQLRRLSSTCPRSGGTGCANAGPPATSTSATATVTATPSRARTYDPFSAPPSLCANRLGWRGGHRPAEPAHLHSRGRRPHGLPGGAPRPAWDVPRPGSMGRALHRQPATKTAAMRHAKSKTSSAPRDDTRAEPGWSGSRKIRVEYFAALANIRVAGANTPRKRQPRPTCWPGVPCPVASAGAGHNHPHQAKHPAACLLAHPSSVFDDLEAKFRYLITGPKPLALHGRTIGHGTPKRPIPLQELRDLLTEYENWPLHDAVMRELLRRRDAQAILGLPPTANRKALHPAWQHPGAAHTQPPEPWHDPAFVLQSAVRAGALRPDEADLLTATQLHGRTLRELAADTAIPYSTLRQRHLRARRRLREFLDAENGSLYHP